MKTTDDDMFELSSGRKFYANNLIIGISPGLGLSEGYDGGIHDNLRTPWTAEEERELADYMIELWTKFRLRASMTKEQRERL